MSKRSDSSYAYIETVLFKELEDKSDKVWRLQTGNADVARRLRRKSGFRQVARTEWGDYPLWIFVTEYSARARAITSLARILGTECEWDNREQLIRKTDHNQKGRMQ
tara:strand:+ start:1319 stop:1639 length:321 start_codon:yes stop_codon:yes gene_type:complete